MNKSLLLGLIFLILFQGCEESKSLNENIISKEYGQLLFDNDSATVAIDVKNYPTYIELHERIQILTCNDSIPEITFKSNDILKTVYIEGFCECLFPMTKQKNIIQIIHDSVFKVADTFPIDSLYYVMKKDYHNNGKDLMYSDSPEKISIEIEYKKIDKTNKFLNLLDKITRCFDSIDVQTPLYIYLSQKKPALPPPPPPIKLNDEE